MMRILWWIKRDLRLADNESLSEACRRSRDLEGEVVPVYLFEPSLVSAPETGALHLQVQAEALNALRSRLRDAGADLLVLRGEAPAVFEELRRELPFDKIYAEEEIGTSLTYQRDRRVRRWSAESGVEFREFPRNGVIRGLRSRDNRMGIWKERMARPLLPEPPGIPMSRRSRQYAAGTTIPGPEELGRAPAAGAVQRVDEAAAERTLESFLHVRGSGYSKGISSPTLSRYTGSRLSVHLAWGTLSVGQVFQSLEERQAELRQDRSVKGWLKPLNAFRSRLFWHDHFCQRLEDEPEMEFHTLNRAFEEIDYDGAPEFEELLWQGRTGFPMVDASLRSLAQTGFVNFRMRAMIVSFATYALHLDWRKLLHPMARIMADYLPGIHISQLQMQAGVVGINTVRVYNPTKQLLDHDPECVFVRRFLPELRPCSNDQIISLATAGVESPSHGTRGRSRENTSSLPSTADYPEPIVPFREKIKEMQSKVYRRKGSPFGKEEASRVLAKHGSRRRRD